MADIYTLGFYENINDQLTFKSIKNGSMLDIIKFTMQYKSQDDMIKKLNIKDSYMYSKIVVNDKDENAYIPLFRNSRKEYMGIIEKNINDMFWDDPKINYDIDKIKSLSDISFINYIALNPILIDVESIGMQKRGEHSCMYIYR